MSQTKDDPGQAGSDRDPGPVPDSIPERSAAEPMDDLIATRDRLLRCLAEQENIRRQAQRDRDEAVRYAASRFAADLLSTADNLDRAIASVPDEQRGDGAVTGLLAGIEATRRALADAFAKHGLRRLEPIGEKFDPNWHEASFEMVDDRLAPGTVATVIQPGYVHHERLLRPALVGVSKPADALPSSGEPADRAEK
jgi:molecular chaperone GrpE